MWHAFLITDSWVLVFQVSWTSAWVLSGGNSVGALLLNPLSNWSSVWKGTNQTPSISVGHHLISSHPISRYPAGSNFSWRSWSDQYPYHWKEMTLLFPFLITGWLMVLRRPLWHAHTLDIFLQDCYAWFVCSNFHPFSSPHSKYTALGVCLHLRLKLDIKGNCCLECGSNCTVPGNLTKAAADQPPPVSPPQTLFWAWWPVLSQNDPEPAALRGTFDMNRPSSIVWDNLWVVPWQLNSLIAWQEDWDIYLRTLYVYSFLPVGSIKCLCKSPCPTLQAPASVGSWARGWNIGRKGLKEWSRIMARWIVDCSSDLHLGMLRLENLSVGK